MPKKRTPVIKLDEVYPETPRELPLRYWVGSLLRFESEEKSLLAAGAGPEALARVASCLGQVLRSMVKLSHSNLRADAALALPEVERFLTHPGRYVEPAHTIYWDWTMDASCAEEVPEVRMTVADEARAAAHAIRSCLPTEPVDGKSQEKGSKRIRKTR